MTNKELQNYLSQFADDLPIMLLPDVYLPTVTIELDEENILHSSETAFVNPDAPEDEWDCEDGKIELGEGQQYLLFNCIIV